MAEEAGLGVFSIIDDNVSNKQLMVILRNKIIHPEDYLPVTNVVTRPSDDGNGTYREMSFGENRIIENIYVDDALLEVKFVVVDSDTEHVNIITSVDGVRKLEFFARNKHTLERTHWRAPKHVAHGGIMKVLDKAKDVQV